MIISASRRTDIPAFYAEWFMNRIKAGYCAVPNPFNRNQVSYVPLRPEDTEVIVFWTRNPKPLLPHLKELDGKGFRYYFQYTLINNPKVIDPKSPQLDKAIKTFLLLAEKIGPDKLFWRYDPIIFSDQTDHAFHLKSFQKIAKTLEGATKRSVISLMDHYTKANIRLREVAEKGYRFFEANELEMQISHLVPVLTEIAHAAGMEIMSCAEECDLSIYGVQPGKCIDDEHIRRIYGIDVTNKKDPSQRKVCGCVVSKDIGMYDSCIYGCRYCYATSSFELSRANHASHNPKSPSLVGWYLPPDSIIAAEKKNPSNNQLSLFNQKW